MTTTKREKPKHLGRGLASLLGPIITDYPETSQPVMLTSIEPKPLSDNTLQNSLQQLPIESIRPNPYQPRFVWDKQELADLAESIKTNGIIQPVIVRPAGTDY